MVKSRMYLFAMLEKMGMYLPNEVYPKEPVTSSAFLDQFHDLDLESMAVFLDGMPAADQVDSDFTAAYLPWSTIAGESILILCNSMGSQVDSKLIVVELKRLTITNYHVFAFSDEVVFVWQFPSCFSMGFYTDFSSIKCHAEQR